jgi:hypothetical protein
LIERKVMIFPKGSRFSFSMTVGAAIAASAVTNDDPAVATIASGIVDGDVVVINSNGWAFADNAVAVASVDSATPTAVTLNGINSTNRALYPAAKSGMTLAVASGFVEFTDQDAATVATSGGEQQYWTGARMEDPSGRQINVPTFKNASALSFSVWFDPDAPWYEAAQEVDAKSEAVVLRCLLPNGDALYRFGYLSFNADPSMGANAPMANSVSFSAQGRVTRVKAVTA